MVAASAEPPPQALVHAERNASVESVFPSGSPPRARTLYVEGSAARDDDDDETEQNKKRDVKTTAFIRPAIVFAIFKAERGRGVKELKRVVKVVELKRFKALFIGFHFILRRDLKL